VANRLRLLDLPEDIKQSVRKGDLSEGHARALLGLPEKGALSQVGRRILDEKLTVREVEKIVADWSTASREGHLRPSSRKDPHVRHLEEDLQRALGRRVNIQTHGKKKGWVKLEFYSIDDLQILLRRLKKQ
jgi:ParB family chromosome partitioning protein